MSEANDQDRKKVLTLGARPGAAPAPAGAPKRPPEPAAQGQVRQSFSHGRSKQVTVEVKRPRKVDTVDVAQNRSQRGPVSGAGGGGRGRGGPQAAQQLTNAEKATRLQALKQEAEAAAKAKRDAEAAAKAKRDREVAEAAAAAEERARAEAEARDAAARPEPLTPEMLRQRELDEMRRIEADEKRRQDEAEAQRREAEARRREADEAQRRTDEDRRRVAERTVADNRAKITQRDGAAERGTLTRPGERPYSDRAGADRAGADRAGADRAGAERPAAERPAAESPAGVGVGARLPGAVEPGVAAEEDDDGARSRGGARRGAPGGAKVAPAKPVLAPKKGAEKRRGGKLTVSQALSDDEDGFRQRSRAAQMRAQAKLRRLQMQNRDQGKVTREVIIPDVITVQELANRMAERGADVIKSLMRAGIMATITQSIDGDTAEVIASEFGHRIRRVSESDVILGLLGADDAEAELQARPPVVTIMGHVDHGKTSLLDAIRQTDVAAGEAGGITQHIGAYQVQMASGERITFIDTPGHAAFTEMRARGANVTDIVVLVVAADDGIMPQTVEALSHAKAARVPIIVAINKCDLPSANPGRVRQDLLQHDLQVEELGGDVMSVEVSAKTRLNLEELEEKILLQAEVLELRANPDRPAQGAVVEAKLERGRGSVATVLVQKGTLKVGDVFVTGSEWGRVRALINDRGQQVDSAGPAAPVEVLGLNGTPLAGDDFVVVEDEARAREIAEFRDRKKREAAAKITARGSVEQMFSQIQEGQKKELAIVIKGDVHGSIEAIAGALMKLAADSKEVSARVLHSAVGAINESDITLAKASDALIIGFNVRANQQARELSRRDGIDIKYYSVIYDVIDDVKGLLSGMLAPTLRETFLGNAEIREVFNITKVGKVAGCMVTEGLVKRGAKVRLLRDNVVIHEGTLKTLKRFKDEVREVREGFECGMAFENYDDIRQRDVIEAFEIEEVARQL